jgi:hypothetical protein
VILDRRCACYRESQIQTFGNPSPIPLHVKML